MTRTTPGIARLLFVVVASVAIGCAGGDATNGSDENTTSVDAGGIVLGSIEGAIGPVSMAYVSRVIDDASDRRAECVVFTMDTPGGLDASMRGIVREILSSSIPVVIFVHPSGSRAASAGAIITLAAHVAVMAPSTNIGAAHPVPLGQQQMDSTMT